MKKPILFALLTAIGLIAYLLTPIESTFGQKGGVRKASEPVGNRYIVVLNDDAIASDAGASEVEARGADLSTIYGGTIQRVYSNTLKGFAVEMTPAQAEAMNTDPSVKFVEEDAVISVSEAQSDAPWHLDRSDQRVLPLNNIYSYASTGAGVHIYIIDTGIRYTHAEFGGRANVFYDNVFDGQNGNDCHGHGTHVAGIAASSTYGVAKGASVHAIRVLPCDGFGSISGLIDGIDWLTANRVNPAVANISITASGSSAALESALSASIASGITYTVSAGNNAQDACNFTPGRTPDAITVGASANTDVRAPYSNFGTCLDIFAPGHGVISLSHASDTGTRVMNGTSMAAPIVAGTAALYLGANPSANPWLVAYTIRNTATPNIVTNTGTGSPSILLYSLVTGAPEPTPTPTVTPTPTPSPSPTPQQAGRVSIRKVVQNAPATSSTAEFLYSATNLAAASFTLANNQQYEDPNVQTPTGQTSVVVTEAAVPGWRVVSIDCSESVLGSQNSTVELGNRRANLLLEPGEEIACTFTSEPIIPTAANVSVSGRITLPGGHGVRGISVTLTDIETGTSSSAVTNSFGYYSFFDVPVQRYYVLTIRTKLYYVENPTYMFGLMDELTGLDFVVRPRKE